MRQSARIMLRHNYNFGVWQLLVNAARNFKPTEVRHCRIDEDYVRLKSNRFFKRISAVRCFGTDQPSPVLLQQGAQPASN